MISQIILCTNINFGFCLEMIFFWICVLYFNIVKFPHHYNDFCSVHTTCVQSAKIHREHTICILSRHLCWNSVPHSAVWPKYVVHSISPIRRAHGPVLLLIRFDNQHFSHFFTTVFFFAWRFWRFFSQTFDGSDLFGCFE